MHRQVSLVHVNQHAEAVAPHHQGLAAVLGGQGFSHPPEFVELQLSEPVGDRIGWDPQPFQLRPSVGREDNGEFRYGRSPGFSITNAIDVVTYSPSMVRR